MDDLLNKLWTSNNYSSSAQKLYKQAKERNSKATLRRVKEFLSTKSSLQVLRKPTKQRFFSSIVAEDVGSNLMIDIMVYNRYQYKGYQYLLNCIDVESRYAVAIPLTNKKITTYIGAMKQVFKKMDDVPRIIQADNEFATKDFTDAMKQAGVKDFWFSQPNDIKHNSVVERFNRTIAMMLQEWRVSTGDLDWVSQLDRVVKVYNNSYHSTIKAKPSDVWDGTDVNTQTVRFVVPNFKVGDRVRYKIDKKIFDKGDSLTYSKDVFEVAEKSGQLWILKNVSTGERLKRKYRDGDLIRASETEVQTAKQTRKKTSDLEDDSKLQLKKKLEKELKKLKGSGVKSKFEKELEELGSRKRTRRN